MDTFFLPKASMTYIFLKTLKSSEKDFMLHVIVSVLFVSVASHDQVAAGNGEASTAAAETPAAEVHVFQVFLSKLHGRPPDHNETCSNFSSAYI